MLTATFTIGPLTEAQQAAVRGLLGRVPRRLALSTLDQALVRAAGIGLVAWLEQLDGPLRDRPAERLARADRRANTLDEVRRHELAGEPWFDEWLEGVRSDGVLTKGDRLAIVTPALAIVAATLRGEGRDRTLASLAAAVTGDTKRLASTTVQSLVERALALDAGVPRPVTSRQRRTLWASFGVRLDDVSSDVLVLNLRASGSGHLAGWLNEAAEAGEPFRVMLRQLSAVELTIESPVIWVCENPAVIAEIATRAGADGGPMICTEGVPSDAFWTLLDRIGTAEVRARADFDASGLTIAGAVLARTGGVPWRFDAATYRRALDDLGERVALPRSRGPLPDSPWDAELSRALAADGRAVYEELLIDQLLEDVTA